MADLTAKELADKIYELIDAGTIAPNAQVLYSDSSSEDEWVVAEEVDHEDGDLMIE